MTRARTASVSVVTVSYNSGPQLAPFLSSIANGDSLPISTLIVNNAEDDRSLAAIAAPFARTEVIEAHGNLGYGAGMNLGVSKAPESDWILIANPDLTVDLETISTLVATGDADPEVGIVGPLIRTTAGEIYPSARRLPSLRNGVGHALLSPLWKSNPWTRAYLADRELPPRRREAGWLSGACLLVRRTAFEEVSGFDDKFFMYFEDVDLCARLSKAGWRIIYAPSATVTHVGGHSTESINRKMIKVHHASAYTYLANKYHAWYLWPLRVTLRFGLKLRGYIAKS